jgi:hypothetical protein
MRACLMSICFVPKGYSRLRLDLARQESTTGHRTGYNSPYIAKSPQGEPPVTKDATCPKVSKNYESLSHHHLM